jgi:hypothetical protein
VRRLEARGRPGVRRFHFDSIGVPSEEVTLVDSPLRNTYWKLVRLSETPVQVAERQREPHLIFATNEPRLSGSGGCKRVTGSFGVDGDKLRLCGMAGTMMPARLAWSRSSTLPAVGREGGALPHPRQPPRDARYGRRRDRAVRGGGVALKGRILHQTEGGDSASLAA